MAILYELLAAGGERPAPVEQAPTPIGQPA
jgi:hypothetical protein